MAGRAFAEAGQKAADGDPDALSPGAGRDVSTEERRRSAGSFSSLQSSSGLLGAFPWLHRAQGRPCRLDDESLLRVEAGQSRSEQGERLFSVHGQRRPNRENVRRAQSDLNLFRDWEALGSVSILFLAKHLVLS